MTAFEDITLDDLAQLDRLEIPTTNARGGWYVSFEETIKVLDFLQIELPVKIRYSTAHYRYGSHYSREGWHRIVLRQNTADIVDSNLTLLHELVHCLQAERFAQVTGRPVVKFYEEAYRHHGTSGARYQSNPFEVHARRTSEKLYTMYNPIREVT